MRVFVEQMQYGFARPTIPAYNEISSALGKKLEQALYGVIPPEKALKDAAKAAKRALRRNR